MRACVCACVFVNSWICACEKEMYNIGYKLRKLLLVLLLLIMEFEQWFFSVNPSSLSLSSSSCMLTSSWTTVCTLPKTQRL